MNKVKEYNELLATIQHVESEIKNKKDDLNDRLNTHLNNAKEEFYIDNEKEYSLVDTLQDALKQLEEEESKYILSDEIKICEGCGKAVEDYSEEAYMGGFRLCDDCLEGESQCGGCGSYGEWGSNWITNGIHSCPRCGQEYCGNCELECECETEMCMKCGEYLDECTCEEED